MENIKFKVEGIHCPKCVSKIVETMNKVDGIGDINVQLESKVASIKYDAGKLSEDKLKNIIDSIEGKDFIATAI